MGGRETQGTTKNQRGKRWSPAPFLTISLRVILSPPTTFHSLVLSAVASAAHTHTHTYWWCAVGGWEV